MADKSSANKRAMNELTLLPTLCQNANVAAERPMTAYANLPLIASAVRCTGAVRACAPSTARTMSAIAVSLPDALLRTVTTPAQWCMFGI